MFERLASSPWKTEFWIDKIRNQSVRTSCKNFLKLSFFFSQPKLQVLTNPLLFPGDWVASVLNIRWRKVKRRWIFTLLAKPAVQMMFFLRLWKTNLDWKDLFLFHNSTFISAWRFSFTIDEIIAFRSELFQNSFQRVLAGNQLTADARSANQDQVIMPSWITWSVLVINKKMASVSANQHSVILPCMWQARLANLTDSDQCKIYTVTGLRLKFGMIWFLRKSTFPWELQTENHNINKMWILCELDFKHTQNNININNRTMLQYCKSNVQESKNMYVWFRINGKNVSKRTLCIITENTVLNHLKPDILRFRRRINPRCGTAFAA